MDSVAIGRPWGETVRGGGLKNGGFGGFWRILEDLEQFIRESPYEGGAGLGADPFATLVLCHTPALP